MMMNKLVVRGITLNIISAYAPQVTLDEENKKIFWEDFDEVYQTLRISSVMDILMSISRQQLVVSMVLISFWFWVMNWRWSFAFGFC